MGKRRRHFRAALKAKIAVEALKGQRTVQKIASSYAVHLNQVTNWKKQLLDFSAEAFSAGRMRSDEADEHLRTERYAQDRKTQGRTALASKKSGLSR
jgi:transposase-like protein